MILDIAGGSMKRIIAFILICLMIASGQNAFGAMGVYDGQMGTEYDNVDLDAQFREQITTSTTETTVRYSDVNDSELMNKLGLLHFLNIMNGYDNGEFRPDSVITRSEFINAAVHLIGLGSETDYPGTSVFYDIERENYPWVYIAAELGIVNGFSDNTFRPDAALSYNEALAFVLRATGWAQYAEAVGGFPAGYIKAASKNALKPDRAIKNAAALTRAEAADILFNVLGSSVCDTNGISSDKEIYESGDTVLKKYHNLNEKNGIVTANKITSLTGKGIGSNTVTIDNESVYLTSGDYGSYIGYSVWYYTDENDCIVYMYKDRKNRETVFDIEDFCGYENGCIKYYAGKKTVSETVSNIYSVLKNGKYTDENISELFNISDGYVILLSNDNDSIYDYIYINEYQNYAADTVTSDGDTVSIVSKYNYKPLEINFRDDTVLEFYKTGSGKVEYDVELVGVYDNDGNPVRTADLSGIGKNVIFSIISDKYSGNQKHLVPAKDAGYVKIMVGSSIEGTLEAWDKSEGIVSIDKKSYRIASNNFLEENGKSLQIGKSGKFYLDGFGKIADFEEKKGEELAYAYLINAAKDKERFSKKLNFKLMETNGNISVYSSDKKIKINGKPLEGDKVLSELGKTAAMLRDGFTVSQPIQFRCRADGTISEIETVLSPLNTDNPDDFHISRDAMPAKYSVAERTEGRLQSDGMQYSDYLGKFHAPGVYFVVPDRETFDENDYTTNKESTYSGTVLELYDVSSTLKPQLAVEYSATGGASSPTLVFAGRSVPAMVKKTYYSKNKDGFTVSALDCIVGNLEKTFLGVDADTFSGLKKGQMITLYSVGGKTDEITSWKEVKYNGNNISRESIPSPDEFIYDRSTTWCFGQVYSRDGYDLCVQAGPVTDPLSGKRESQYTCYYNLNLAWMFGGAQLYDETDDKNNPEIRAAAPEDIKTVEKDGESSASYVFWLAKNGGARQLVIYNISE